MQPATLTLRLLDHFFIITPAKTLQEAEGALPLQIGNPPAFLLEAPVATLQLTLHRLAEYHRHTTLSAIFVNGIIDVITSLGCTASMAIIMVAMRTTLAGPRVKALQQDDPEFIKKAKYIFTHPTPFADAVSSVVGTLIGGILSVPMQVARTQYRHEVWRGWRNTLPSRSSGLSAGLYAFSVTNFFCIIGNTHLRVLIYDALGRPFVHPAHAKKSVSESEDVLGEAKEKEARPNEEGETRSIEEEAIEEQKEEKGKEKVDEGETDTKETQETKEIKDAEVKEIEDTRGLSEWLSYHATIRGISLGTTLAIGIIHLPVLTITHRLILNPGEGVSQCVRALWEAEGWRGFYKGAWWYLLLYAELIFPPVTIPEEAM